eukprot:150136_1
MEEYSDYLSLLKSWQIPYSLVDKLESEGWTEPAFWGNIDDDSMDNMGFNEGHKILFRKHYAKYTENKEDKLDKHENTDWQNLLRSWGIPTDLINNMKKSGWTNVKIWDEINNDELIRLGFGNGHIVLFNKNYNEWKKSEKK